jgi:hypothetical protein
MNAALSVGNSAPLTRRDLHASRTRAINSGSVTAIGTSEIHNAIEKPKAAGSGSAAADPHDVQKIRPARLGLLPFVAGSSVAVHPSAGTAPTIALRLVGAWSRERFGDHGVAAVPLWPDSPRGRITVSGFTLATSHRRRRLARYAG